MNKKAAMEMSMGTIVTIVLLISVLVLGLVFVRNIMCSGIVLTDKITENVENEIKDLFGTKDYGVRCMGEGQEVTLGDDGRRQISCVINVDTATEYEIEFKGVEVLTDGPYSDSDIEDWILDQDWDGPVSPGFQTETVLILDVPREASAVTIKLKFRSEDRGASGTADVHFSIIDIRHVGTMTSTVC